MKSKPGNEKGKAAHPPPPDLMLVRVQTPTGLLIEAADIRSLSGQTEQGRCLIEPRRLDGTVPLLAGILTLKRAGGQCLEAAIDEGILVKCGHEVTVSVRHALTATGQETLPTVLRQKLKEIRDGETELRTALQELETQFMRQFAEARRRN